MDLLFTIATACLFSPHMDASWQLLLNPITICGVFLGTNNALDAALLATVWSSGQGRVILPLIGLSALAFRLPLYAGTLCIPILRQIHLNFKPGEIYTLRHVVAGALLAACVSFQLSTGTLVPSHTRTGDIADSSWSFVGTAPGSWPLPHVFARPVGGGLLLSLNFLQPFWYLRSLAFIRHISYFDIIAVAHPLLYVIPLTLRFW